MVRLFASDIDGCLSEPFVPFVLDDFAELRRLTRLPGAPAFTLCTGRPLGYAEATAQALDVRLPFLFEAGAGMYDLTTGRRAWHPDFGPEQERAIAAIQEHLESVVRGTDMSVDRGKHTQAGVIGADTDDILRARDQIQAYVTDHHAEFVVAHTPISVDIMHRALTKREGLLWLGRELGIDIADMAFIGDTGGDKGALELVGTSFAPANATGPVKRAVHHVLPGTASKAVLAAYQACIASSSSP
ncbi:MAG: HAD family phosphatase [Rhodothermales bacterium]|nr:HAD family phosphatase [Rhodothermales bacterium]MBO6778268.1 HAD family phosphatase [Rhodothermales bacterium]